MYLNSTQQTKRMTIDIYLAIIETKFFGKNLIYLPLSRPQMFMCWLTNARKFGFCVSNLYISSERIQRNMSKIVLALNIKQFIHTNPWHKS